MALSPGTLLGSFEISGLLGVGGMGEVYRARDTKLGREVAIKVLPEVFAKDEGRLARFEREAKLLAALDHPNIAGIHELQEADGIRFLVMQLAEGATLAERISLGPIPVEEALSLFAQIAEALESAHERGVIHRDLKPANIKISDDGRVKILDFGLAKAFEAEASDSTSGRTLTLGTDPSNITAEGRVLGTPAYMAPEQATGKPVDRRADIWAFGCCFFEALIGKRPFRGETAPELLADIIRGEPDWNALPANTPGRVRVLLWRCLQKDPRRRLRDIGEAVFEITETSSDPSGAFPALGATAAPEVLRREGNFRAVLALIIGAVAASALTWALTRPGPPEPEAPKPVRRYSIILPESAPMNDPPELAISPTEPILVYVAQIDGQSQLYSRRLDQLEAQPIPGTTGGRMPFFSPDGQWIGFFSPQQGKLMKTPVYGGASIPICDAVTPYGASWGDDGTIVFQSAVGGGIQKVPSAGGTPEVITTGGGQSGGAVHLQPSYLPGSHAVFFSSSNAPSIAQNKVVLLDLESGELRIIAESARSARYIPSGHLHYFQDGVAVAVPFDLSRLEPTGTPVPATQPRMPLPPESEMKAYAFSPDGTLVYAASATAVDRRQTLVWVDRDGNEEPIAAALKSYQSPSASPDGRRIAFVEPGSSNQDIWIFDLERGSTTRFTFNSSADQNPTWSPDGGRLVFMSNRGGDFGFYVKPIDGSEEPELIWASPTVAVPYRWIDEPETILYITISRETGLDVGALSLGDDPSERLLINTRFAETNPAVSPDRRWIAYTSDESGKDEIYVRSYLDLGGQWQISIEGGRNPIWSPDGKELFFRGAGKVMAVGIESEPSFTAGTPQPLFEDPYDNSPGRNYDISPDGRRFLMIKNVGTQQNQSARTEIIVVENWFEELKRLAPPGEVGQ